ncbi:MAG TPA: hypothetical protein VJ853_09255, partial [Thermoanaerobaculia bacterium]|nr:hypothetical protein [Thermoanaerobaculia bacterium]
MRRRAVVAQPAAAPAKYGAFSIYTGQSFVARSFVFEGRFFAAHAPFAIVFFYNVNQMDALGATDGTIQLRSAGNLVGSIDTGVVPAADRWYRFRIEADDSGGATAIRARVWEETAAEPQTFAVNAADATPGRLTAGNIGIWSGGGDFYVDDLAVKSGEVSASAVTFIDAATNETLDPSAIATFGSAARINVIASSDTAVTL